ncbi:MAG: glycosyltransferase [Nostoc sp. ChiSLP02]|nr:glycosyltransferase [Nostoc sp. DedSLP05]MDZ8099154.1 glycosyltransferase [Nostoc sp. DedSLP01]MDZ8185429.1 glycosyltransferase [Nostoc sp. ChiSLP02]
MKKSRASIIITNYNYGHFLREAIESALNQTYQPTEVIVVDDGSTDNSQQIIANYGKRIVSVLKENGGQGSAFNAGFAASCGQVVCFLDADDVLLPNAIERAVELLHESNAVKVHWPLSAIDVYGKPLGKLYPEKPLPEGDLLDAQLSGGVDGHIFSPTSGNAWTRSYLKRILPIPEIHYRINADSYLAMLAPLFGRIQRIDEHQALYRIHGNNGTSKTTYRWQLNQYQYEMTILHKFLQEQNIQIKDAFECAQSSGYSHIKRMVELGEELEPLIPLRQKYILVDMDEWGWNGQLLENRRSIPFLEKDGMYWGPPPDDAIAIKEFERLHHEGASFIVFGSPAFWWLDYYAEFVRYLRTRFRCVLENERLVVFDLQGIGNNNEKL